MKDRSLPRNAMGQEHKKDGAGLHNWGSLRYEQELEEEAEQDEEREHEGEGGGCRATVISITFNSCASSLSPEGGRYRPACPQTLGHSHRGGEAARCRDPQEGSQVSR